MEAHADRVHPHPTNPTAWDEGMTMKSTRWIAAGGALLALGYALDFLHGLRRQVHKESQLDEALDGTFPASDPTATQDFAIPVNRL